MIVVLPSGREVAVPADVKTIAELKPHLEAATGIPVAVQRFFQDQAELKEGRRFDSLRPDAPLDLVIVVGSDYAICHHEKRDKLNHLTSEIFASRASVSNARDPDALAQEPEIVIYDPPPAEEHPTQARHDAAAAPYLAAFAAHKETRQSELRRICAELDDGPLVAGTFNWGYRDMFENWAASCEHHGIDARRFTVIFPMDADADELARERGFRTLFDDVSYGELPRDAHEEFGDEIFAKCMFAKSAMTQDMLDIGADVLRQDLDMVWLRDPRRHLKTRAEREGLDFLFMYDGPNARYEPLHYNSGFVYIRNTPFSRRAWYEIFSRYRYVQRYRTEQWVINLMMSCFRERGLRTERLPEDVFVNGHVISRCLANGRALPRNAAVVHASWTSNIEPKVKHLREFGLWYL